MAFQDKKETILWNLHLRSSPEKVFKLIATDAGRAKYWAESAKETDGVIEFKILNYPPFTDKILKKDFPVFGVEYYGTKVTFTVSSDGKNGIDLQLLAEDVSEDIRMEMAAGWVSVLLALKAAADFSVDLRNHELTRSWQNSYVDN